MDRGPLAALTAREREILLLLQQRLTNAEIAERLFVSIRTVDAHVSAILRKLQVSSRRQLADVQVPHGASFDAAGVQLPALREQLLGRDELIEHVATQLIGARVITLTGAGGVGKTSAALAVAHRLAEQRSDGAAFVDLVPARSPGDVLRAVTGALGVEGDAARSHADLAAYLASRSTLVVLDNCEHVIGAAAELVDAVLTRPGAWRILATSREPLGLRDEHVVPVEPLGAAAVQLFVDRARRLEPRIEWNVDDPRIVELCGRLDGLPLAVELAAGQVRRWSLDELNRRLQDPDQNLPAPALRATPRHRTMAAAIDWSYTLLDDDEQRLLRHLGVFPAAFRLTAVAAMAPLFPNVDLDELLAALVDKSLVVRDLGADSYRLLESIRADALDRLDRAGERAAAFEWHRQWMVGIARSTSRMDRWTSARLSARQHADAEHARQAFWTSLDGGRHDDAVELAIGRSFEWRNAIGCAEGHRWVDALGARQLGPDLAAWVAVLRADIALGDGDFFPMITAAQEAIALAGDRDQEAFALAQCFLMLQHLLDPSAADAAIESVLAISPDPRLTALLRVFVLVAHAGRLDADERDRLIDELDDACTADGYERFMLNWAMWLHGLALREAPLANRGIGQQYDYLRSTGMPETWLTAFSLSVTQMIDGVSGRQQLAAALAIADREGYRIAGDCVIALAYSEVCAGRPTEAAELLGLARACRFNATANHVLQRVVVDPLVRAAITRDEYRAAIERGRSASVDETLAGFGITSPA